MFRFASRAKTERQAIPDAQWMMSLLNSAEIDMDIDKKWNMIETKKTLPR